MRATRGPPRVPQEEASFSPETGTAAPWEGTTLPRRRTALVP